MAVLNSNPEVLLRKRKNADRKRLQKQEALRAAKETQKGKPKVEADKFVRAERLAARNKANKIEEKRIKNILKHEQKSISQKKESEPKLLFVLRVPHLNKDTAIPPKAEKVLHVLRLTEENMGVFVKMTPTVVPALKLISPYIVVGKPSLNSVRELFQKRAAISDESSEGGVAKLDNNQVVEDKFGDSLGFVCVEDLVHEIFSLGEHFKEVSHWLVPFRLSAPVRGKSALAQLSKLQYEQEMKKGINLSGHVALEEIDIDQHIAQQN